MALPNTNITPGSPPLLWSDVQEAFRQVNENFDSVAAALGVAGLTPIDFETLDTSVSPTNTVTYSLGSDAKRWRAVYTGEWANTPTQENNGVWLGSAQIRGITGTVDLPVNSTVNGNLIIDPTKTAFKTISVAGESDIVADSFTDTLTIVAGTAISITTNPTNDSLTINNDGVTELTQGTGITLSGTTGNITVTNNGVRSATAGSPIVGRAVGLGISIGGTPNDITVTNTGIISITQGAGITVSTDDTTGNVTITNNAANVFRNIAVDGQSTIIADSVSDTLTVEAGYGLVITTDDVNDKIIFALNQRIDIKGTIFADDSTILVDGVDGRIVGDVYNSVVSTAQLRTSESKIALGANAGNTSQGNGAIAIGFDAGGNTQGNTAVSIGSGAGNTGQGANAVAVGYLAGNTSQGANAVAIGYNAGALNQTANSIIINATGSALTSGASGFYVDPIRSTANGRPLMYDATTKELFHSNVLEFIGSTLSTSDSSGISVDVQTTFNTNVNVEGTLTVNDGITGYISLSELKAVVAASSSFNDFQSRIAALV